MCEKQIEVEAMREKLAKVSKERDMYYALWGDMSRKCMAEDKERRIWRNSFMVVSCVATALLVAVLVLVG